MRATEFITEIGWAAGIPPLVGLNVDGATKLGDWENLEIYGALHGHEMFLFFNSDNKVAAYITLVEGTNNRVHLVRMENASGPPGSITALVSFAISHWGYKLSIDRSEDLTDQGFSWLVKLINSGGRGMQVTDQNGREIDVTALKKEHESAKRSGRAGPTSVYIENVCLKKPHIQEGQGLLQPAYRFLYDTDLD